MVEQIRNREAGALRRAEKELAQAKEQAAQIKRLTVTVYAKTGEAGRLFGSVTNADIAAAVRAQLGVEVDRRDIALDEPLKELGVHEINVKLHPEVSATLHVEVVAGAG